MAHFVEVVETKTGQNMADKPGSGAAGGIGFLLYSLINAEFRSGLELMVEWSKLNVHLNDTDLVITGEGKMDGQSLFGKVPIGIARIAKKESIPVIAFAGVIGEGFDKLEEEGITAVIPIVDNPVSLEEAMHQGEKLLYLSAKRTMELLQLGKNLNSASKKKNFL